MNSKTVFDFCQCGSITFSHKFEFSGHPASEMAFTQTNVGE